MQALAGELDDFLSRATKQRWSPPQILEHLTQTEAVERAHRSLERRLRLSEIKKFKPMADFDWSWPTKIDRDVIERALTLDFLPEGRQRKLRTYANVGLLCVDEVGYLSPSAITAYLILTESTSPFGGKTARMATSRRR